MAFGTPQAKFQITAEDKSDRAFRSVKQNLGAVNQGMTAISRALGPLLGVSGFSALTRQIVDFGSELTDVATRINATVEGVQALQRAALQAGTPKETIEKSAAYMQVRFQDALQDPAGKTAQAFLNLGIRSGYFDEQTLESQMEQIAAGYTSASGANQGMADWSLAQIFGQRNARYMKEPLSILNQRGFAGMRSYFDASTESAQFADRISDTMALGGQNLKTFILEAMGRNARIPIDDPAMLAFGPGAGRARTAMQVVGLDDESRQLFREIRDAVKEWSVFK